jgi:hypothetical protein
MFIYLNCMNNYDVLNVQIKLQIHEMPTEFSCWNYSYDGYLQDRE